MLRNQPIKNCMGLIIAHTNEKAWEKVK